MNKKAVIIIRNAKRYDFGGGERFPVFLAETLRKHDYDATIISRSKKLQAFAKDRSVAVVNGWWWSNQNWSGLRVLLFPVYVLWQLVLCTWYVQVFLRRQPAAVHVQSKDDFIAATIAGKITGSRVIWTDHADLKHIWQNLRVWYKNPVGKLVYLTAFLADAVTLVSESEKKLVTVHLRPHSKVRNKLLVIYNGVNDHLKEYGNVKKDTDDFVFCVANRLVTDKGIGEVIDAFNLLTREHPNSQLVLIGDGPEAEQFKKRARANKKITFAGHQLNPLPFIAKSDVFIQPTYHEGFSVALVEASMLKKPIIATAVGGNVEIIHNGTTGLLVAAKNSIALHEAMKQLIENQPLCAALAEHARAQYENRFDFDHIVTQAFIPLYRRNK